MAAYDIGMLRVFVLIYETGSATLAAERMSISQPSVSYTLRKLRNHFGDVLFQRHGQRLEPTPVADELYPRLRRILESMDEIMASSATFSPATSRRHFRLRMTDVGIGGLLPRLLHRVRSEAPHVALEVELLNLPSIVQDLRSGSTDAAIFSTRLDAPDLLREALFRQRYIGICPIDHPRIGEHPTLAEYEAEQHVTVAISTGHTALDQKVRELGVQRTVALVVPTFSSLPSLMEGTDLLSYAPTSVANRLVRQGGVRTFPLPFEVPMSEIALYTIRRELPSAEFDWFRRTIVEALH
ncbi:LysR family transcriptional regulator [Salinibacterium sp. dk2585]|uniref:LysR family transcriptional regulator n=1 Tax=unclassified Salinibacterium TaxID=2632331 RepID=UPI0011C24377|nr:MULTISPECIES: LysR family transcriptional regulator [unclassified Salinibacterium]QEE60387.1 LysR family transcriptional regulator [Salinibacterium sp. dk2585]TXK55460.1 LysR family transcriptional regulator [Salinibacterium sp. dk5596]